MNKELSNLQAGLVKAFDDNEFKLEFLKDFRAKSASKIAQLPMPVTRDEEWKFVNLKELARTTFLPVSGTSAVDISHYYLPEAAEITLVFINGEYRADMSKIGKLPVGVSVATFEQADEKQMQELETHLSAFEHPKDDVFAAINGAFADNGVFVYIPKDTKIESPIHILNIVTDEATNALITPRVLVCADKFAKATLVENYIGTADNSYLSIPVTEIRLDEGASLTHYRIQRESKQAFHINRIGTHLEKSSHYESYTIHFGSKLSRADVRANLAGTEADCTLDGLVLISGEQESDTHTVMHHQQPHCTSHQLHKVVVDDNAHSVFNGKIWVDQIAQKTDSFQENRNIILSDSAKVDTKPQLEIFADDVKCSHGATVGQLNEEEVFYLKSRGLDDMTSKELLMYGYALEVIENINIKTLKEQLSKVVSNFAHRIAEHSHA